MPELCGDRIAIEKHIGLTPDTGHWVSYMQISGISPS